MLQSGSCGECKSCKSDNEQYCTGHITHTYNVSRSDLYSQALFSQSIHFWHRSSFIIVSATGPVVKMPMVDTLITLVSINNSFSTFLKILRVRMLLLCEFGIGAYWKGVGGNRGCCWWWCCQARKCSRYEMMMYSVESQSVMLLESWGCRCKRYRSICWRISENVYSNLCH